MSAATWLVAYIFLSDMIIAMDTPKSNPVQDQAPAMDDTKNDGAGA